MKKNLLLVAVSCILLTGCTGPFVLTQNLHEWQTSFEDKWVDEVAFLGCVIIPVYGVTTLVDAIVFNSVEFWTGENPMDTVQTPVGDEMCLRSVATQM